MSKQLHHVVMRSHSAKSFVAFLTDVVGMEVQFKLRVPGEVLEKTLGWPPSDGADVTMVGSGEAGLIEVLDVPEHLRDIAPEGLAALSFLTDEFGGAIDDGESHSQTTSRCSTPGSPGVDLFFCTDGRRARRVHGRLCTRSELRNQRRDEGLSAPTRLAPFDRVTAERNHPNGEIGDAGVAIAAQARQHCRLVARRHRVSDVFGVAVFEQSDVVGGEVGVPEHLAGVGAGAVDLALGAECDGNACHDAGFGSSGSTRPPR